MGKMTHTDKDCEAVKALHFQYRQLLTLVALSMTNITLVKQKVQWCHEVWSDLCKC